MVVLTNEALPYEEPKLVKKCFKCREHKWRIEFQHIYARRCLACEARQAKAKCKHCGEFPGIDARHKARQYCEKPECQQARLAERGRASAEARTKRAKAATTHVCKPCGRCLPKTPEFFPPVKRDPVTNEITKLSGWCNDCKNATRRDRYAVDPAIRERVHEYDRARRARDAERRAVDPEFDREYRRKRAKHARDAYWRKKNAPQEEQQGTPKGSGSGPQMPVAPLYAAFTDWRVRMGMDIEPAAGRCGMDGRTVRRWETGEAIFVRQSTADGCLIAMDLLWFDVWPEDQYPDVAKHWEGE